MHSIVACACLYASLWQPITCYMRAAPACFDATLVHHCLSAGACKAVLGALLARDAHGLGRALLSDAGGDGG